jgi:DNA primase
MKFNIFEFCEEYQIDIKQQSQEWINVECPFCGDKDNLGFNIKHSYFNCWECGFHTPKEYVAETIGMNEKSDEVFKELLKYSSKTDFRAHTMMLESLKKEINNKTKDMKLPAECTNNISDKMIGYLEDRGFDAQQLIKKYRLFDTPRAFGKLQKRVIIPIIYNGIIVSYTARDYSGKSDLRYISCDKDSEVINHKNILYNLDNCKEDWCIVNEGIFDNWKLGGDNCCAIFGISYKQSQVNVLAKRFKKICIYFDNDAEAIKQSIKLSEDLQILGAKTLVYRYNISKDPGDLSIEEGMKIYNKLKAMMEVLK